MNKKSNLLYLLAGLFLALFLTAASSTETNNNKQYCYALIAPIEDGNNGSSRIIKSDCFDNFADSISAATNGRVLLNHSARPNEVTNEILNSNNGLSSLSSQVVIGIDWDDTNFGGSSNTWTVSGSGCSNSVKYSASSMPSGWDNRVSSARGYSGCNYYYHYQDTNYGGSSVVCNTECATMGSLDNATSSEKWSYTP
jgi:hypothetical protein